MTNEELLREYYDGDDRAFESLYKRNLGFIKKIAVEAATDFHCMQYQTSSKEKYTTYTGTILNDLCAEGAAELWDRIQRREFDESKARLTTYLYPHLKGRMYRWLEQNIGPMALSKDEMALVRQAQKLYYADWKDTAEVAAEMGISVEDAAKHIGYNTHFYSEEDWDDEPEDADPYDFNVQNKLSISPDRIIYIKLCVEYLEPLFHRLSEKDKYILGHYYGAYGYEQFSVDEIGLREMLTKDGVKKAVKIGERHLKKLYPGSRLHHWVRANHLVRKAWNAAADI